MYIICIQKLCFILKYMAKWKNGQKMSKKYFKKKYHIIYGQTVVSCRFSVGHATKKEKKGICPWEAWSREVPDNLRCIEGSCLVLGEIQMQQ